MNKTHVLVCIVLLLFLSSCSKGTMYTAVQNHQRAECLRLPSSQHEECIDELNMHYNMYKSKRKELFENKQSGKNEKFFEETNPAQAVRF